MLVVALATGALLIAGPSEGGEHQAHSSSSYGNSAFCAPGELVRDFGLSRLPSVRQVPMSADLPFGPKTVDIGSSGGPILPIGESFGFELHSENYAGRTPLHWTLRARMFAVTRGGARAREVDHVQITVKTIGAGDEVQLYLNPLRRAGFYLYELEILDEDEKLLGRYGEYLKVFARSYWKARLGLSKRAVEPGQRILSRVENLGTETFTYGEIFRVERREGEEWLPVPELPQRRWAMWLGIAGPGAAGRCSALYLPEDIESGAYRVVKRVSPYRWPRGGRSYLLTAVFKIAR